jgi:hypothetical protein
MLVEKFKKALQEWKPDEEILAGCLNEHVRYAFENDEFYDVITRVAEKALRERFGIEETEQ